MTSNHDRRHSWPDVEGENRPDDYAEGKDPQLERGLVEVMRPITENAPLVPESDKHPTGA